MERVRVLVVDDSVVVRRLVTDALVTDPRVEVVGVAANGLIALSKVEQLRPDVVTMDIEMPVMDGIEAVRALRAARHRMPIIMFSTLTERGAVATLDALAAGATDYVAKPSGTGSVQQSLDQVAAELLPRIRALVARGAAPSSTGPRATGAPTGAPTGAAPARTAPAPVRRRPPPSGAANVRAVVIGSSTGGPEALTRVLGGLSTPLPVPVVVVQHMPPVFTTQLAARLDRIGPSRVVEAAGGERLTAGSVYLAPGDIHLRVTETAGGVVTQLDHGPPVNFCRPSVDVLFRSAAGVYGPGVLAVVLTGMGSDGRDGAATVADAGGLVLAQDEPTSVVWGMPGAVTTGGHAHAVLPLDDVGPAVVRAVAGRPLLGDAA